MRDLLSKEGQSTRDHNTKEARQVEKSIKEHTDAQAKAQETREVTQKRRERLLGSLQFPEMNHRRNHITDPHEATFRRIFQSYQRTGASTGQNSRISSAKLDEIDRAWEDFVQWLQSEISLFWIQGKPGSGKSTLVRKIIRSEITKTLLDQWRPGTKILSHFFWRIGLSLQSNTRGLYSTLIYQLFEQNDRLIDHILARFTCTISKTFLNDWSITELRDILIVSLQFDQDAFCIFIDGLDEYYEKDGQDELLKKIKPLTEYPNVKLCVASRPEPQLQYRLSQFSNLKLHDLTWPDMMAYAQSELANLEMDCSLTPKALGRICSDLLYKAQGVFLWLRLALRSLKDGIEWGDSKQLLAQRLTQLPDELDELYAEMWKRNNRDEKIYRKSAAQYFRFVIECENLKPVIGALAPSLLEISCIMAPESQKRLLDLNCEVDLRGLRKICDKTQQEIAVRCAGLLEIRSDESAEQRGQLGLGRVCFIHRTAHDFLTDTPVGQQILQHTPLSSVDIYYMLVQSHMCYARVTSFLLSPADKANNAATSLIWIHSVLDLIEKMLKLGGGKESRFKTGIVHLLRTAETFYSNAILHDLGLQREFYPYSSKSQYASLVAKSLILNDFFSPFLETTDASMATDILRALEWRRWFTRDTCGPSLEVVQWLLSQDADPVSIVAQRWLGPPTITAAALHYKCAIRTTALWNILVESLRICGPPCTTFSPTLPKSSPRYKEATNAIGAMLEACHYRAINDWGLVMPVLINHKFGQRTSSFMIPCIPEGSKSETLRPVFEVNISYLLKMFLDHLPSLGEPGLAPWAGVIRDRIANFAAPQLRFILFSSRSGNDGSVVVDLFDCPKKECWFRVMDQAPLQDIIHVIFNDTRDLHWGSFQPRMRRWRETTMALIKNQNVLQQVGLDEVLEAPGSERRLGMCSLKDAGFIQDDELVEP